MPQIDKSTNWGNADVPRPASASLPRGMSSKNGDERPRQPLAAERTRSLISFALLLRARGAVSAKVVDLDSSTAQPRSNEAWKLTAFADAYALVGACRLDVNLATCFRAAAAAPARPGCTLNKEGSGSAFVLQVAYNESITSDSTRFAFTQLRALVALLKVREIIVSAQLGVSGPCTSCPNLHGCAEDEVVDFILASNAEVIDRRISRGRQPIASLLDAVCGESDAPRYSSQLSTCGCGRWLAPYSGGDAWTTFKELLELLKQWDGRKTDDEMVLRKNIVFAAHAVAVADGGRFLQMTSVWTQHLVTPQLSLAQYVTRLAQFVDAITQIMSSPVPTNIELVGEAFPAFDFPSPAEMCRLYGAAALSAAGLLTNNHVHHTTLQQCSRALSKQTQSMSAVIVHAEVKLLVHWLETMPGDAPVANYIATSRKPCFACASFFHAVCMERGTSPPPGDDKNLIRCAPSSTLIHPRWQFPDFDLLTEDHQLDRVRVEKIYKRVRWAFRAELAVEVGLPVPV